MEYKFRVNFFRWKVLLRKTENSNWIALDWKLTRTQYDITLKPIWRIQKMQKYECFIYNIKFDGILGKKEPVPLTPDNRDISASESSG